jgi:hypothetical protein
MSDPEDPNRYGEPTKAPHWCELCRGHTGPNSPCHSGDDYQADDDGPTTEVE